MGDITNCNQELAGLGDGHQSIMFGVGEAMIRLDSHGMGWMTLAALYILIIHDANGEYDGDMI